MCVCHRILTSPSRVFLTAGPSATLCPMVLFLLSLLGVEAGHVTSGSAGCRDLALSESPMFAAGRCSHMYRNINLQQMCILITQAFVQYYKTLCAEKRMLATSGSLSFVGGEADEVGALGLHPGNELTVLVTTCCRQGWGFWVVALRIIVI